jgi:hypothetical protein
VSARPATCSPGPSRTGLLAVAFAWRRSADLRARGWAEPARQLAVTAVLAGARTLPFLLPADADPLDVPAGLLRQSRLLALATGLLLWAGLGVAFGLLSRARVDTTRDREPAVAP